MIKRSVAVAVLSSSLVLGTAVPANAATTTEQVRISAGFGLYLNLWGNEAMWVAANLLRATTGGSVAACAAAKVPVAYATIAKILCGAAGAVGMNSIQGLAGRLTAIGRLPGANKMCVQMKIVPFLPETLHFVRRGNC